MADTKSGFSDDERAAMKQRAEELRSTKGLKGAAKLARELEACVKAIDGLDGVDGAVATRLHTIVSEEAPELAPKTFYGFPAYARDGKVVVFYQPASKFDTRYGTVNFDDTANLDDGEMWPTSFAVIEMTDAAEERIRELVRRAVS
ncbi:hypothetical protein [Microbacterium karelineae]|uniref:hypothetical protein n=1 Tax=Microbacterium karelineae TaxID=2654283 RepID=UPI0012E9FA46|nr:hypothetical protein [Microbacterium karelineae]